MMIDMLEHRSIPRIRSLLSSYGLVLDHTGRVTRWHRTSRLTHGQQA